MTVYTVTGNEEKNVKKWSNSADCGNNSSKNGESHTFLRPSQAVFKIYPLKFFQVLCTGMNGKKGTIEQNSISNRKSYDKDCLH